MRVGVSRNTAESQRGHLRLVAPGGRDAEVTSAIRTAVTMAQALGRMQDRAQMGGREGWGTLTWVGRGWGSPAPIPQGPAFHRGSAEVGG